MNFLATDTLKCLELLKGTLLCVMNLFNCNCISVFVNKTLLSGQDKIDAPLFVTWYQCIVTVLACYLIRQVARYFPARVSFPELQLDSHVMKQVIINYI